MGRIEPVRSAHQEVVFGVDGRHRLVLDHPACCTVNRCVSEARPSPGCAIGAVETTSNVQSQHMRQRGCRMAPSDRWCRVVSINSIQFVAGLSMSGFIRPYSTEARCSRCCTGRTESIAPEPVTGIFPSHRRYKMSNIIQFVAKGAYPRSKTSNEHYEIPYEIVEDMRDWLCSTVHHMAAQVCLIWLYESGKNQLDRCLFPVDKWDKYTVLRRNNTKQVGEMK